MLQILTIDKSFGSQPVSGSGTWQDLLKRKSVQLHFFTGTGCKFTESLYMSGLTTAQLCQIIICYFFTWSSFRVGSGSRKNHSSFITMQRISIVDCLWRQQPVPFTVTKLESPQEMLQNSYNRSVLWIATGVTIRIQNQIRSFWQENPYSCIFYLQIPVVNPQKGFTCLTNYNLLLCLVLELDPDQ